MGGRPRCIPRAKVNEMWDPIRRHRKRAAVQRLAAVGVLLGGLAILTVSADAASPVVFSDGFETNNLAKWTASSGMTVQSADVMSGSYAAEAAGGTNATYAYKSLTTPLSDLYYDGRFKVVSQGNNNVSIVRFRTATGAAILSIIRRNDGSFLYYNEVTGLSTVGPQITLGAWHELEVHPTINGSAGQIEAWLDGAKILTKADALGATAVGRVYIGDPAASRIYTTRYDDQLIATASDFTAPAAPTNLTATPVGSTRVDLAWTASSDNVGVTGYTMYRNGSPIGTTSSPTFSDAATVPGQTYNYAVDASDAAGNTSAKSAVTSVAVPNSDLTPPTTPGGVAASATSSTSVRVTWSASTDAVGVAGYGVYRGGTLIATLASNAAEYLDVTLVPSSTYQYSVDAFDAAANRSPASAPVSVTTPAPPDVTPPTAPTGLAAVALDSAHVQLTWSASTDGIGVVGYTLFRGGVALATLPATPLSYNDATVQASAMYTYTLDAFDAAGNHSTTSDPATVTTPTPPDLVGPTVPSNLRGQNTGMTSVHIAWDASTDNVGVTGYDVFRAGQHLAYVDGATTAYDDSGLSAATAYQYAVVAYDAASNQSALSDPLTVMTAAPPDTSSPSSPSQVGAVGTSGTSIHVTWAAATDNVGVIAYELYRDGSLLTTVAGSFTDFDDTGLGAGVTLTYALIARDAAGNSSLPSATATATTLTTADLSAPSVPQGLTVSVLSTSAIQISWSSASDNIGVTGYSLYRNGTIVANTGSSVTTITDGPLQNSTTYSYSVDAFDAVGNHSAASTPVSGTTLGVLFSDGFESGNLSAWSASVGTAVQTSTVFSGTRAALLTASAGSAYSQRNLAPTMTDGYFGARVKVISQSLTDNVSLFRIRTSAGGPIVSIFRRGGNSRLQLYNEITGVTTTSATSLSASIWHLIELHARVGTSGLVELWIDGNRVTDLSMTANLGTSNIGRFYVGDPATPRTFQFAVDDSVVTSSPDVVPPTSPTNVTAAALSGRRVNLSWSASTDDVGITAYQVYRSGILVATVGGTATGWADAGISANSAYTYAIAAQDPAGNLSAKSDLANASTPADTGGDPVIAAVGDISCDPANPNFNGGLGTNSVCAQRATSDLVWNDGQVQNVLTLGDHQYEDATLSKFKTAFDPSWGRVRGLIRPIPGNHEYLNSGADGYFSYFGAAAGSRTKGYYSYDIGAWHVIALNGECSQVGGCTNGSPQEQWLASDLAAHPAACTLAYWHEPRFSSGEHGNNVNYSSFWIDLYAAHADIVLNGHDHNYERFLPQNPSGQAVADGITEFVVGTGGAERTLTTDLKANSAVFDNLAIGVLKLTLHPTSFDYRFLSKPGGTQADTGTRQCQ